ncbi:hypothetical protein Tco_0492145 [Tanacetum coccineum]
MTASITLSKPARVRKSAMPYDYIVYLQETDFDIGIDNDPIFFLNYAKAAQAKRLFGNENVWVEMHRGIAWDKVENLNPQSTPQVLPSFEENTPPVTYPDEVEEIIGIPIEVEPLDETPLEDLGLDTCNHDIPLTLVQ